MAFPFVGDPGAADQTMWFVCNPVGRSGSWHFVCNKLVGNCMTDAADNPIILIAEDQEHVREALAMLLRGHHYTVVLCASPNEALLAAEQQTPDLAMLDMNYQ